MKSLSRLTKAAIKRPADVSPLNHGFRAQLIMHSTKSSSKKQTDDAFWCLIACILCGFLVNTKMICFLAAVAVLLDLYCTRIIVALICRGEPDDGVRRGLMTDVCHNMYCWFFKITKFVVIVCGIKNHYMSPKSHSLMLKPTLPKPEL